MTTENDQKEWYKEYYSKAGGDRNNLRTNPGVMFQLLAMESAVVRALRVAALDLSNAKILDVGCGGGSNTSQLLRLGAAIKNLTGIDIFPERLEAAKSIYPNARWVQGDASRMGFSDREFDLVAEFTMFATLPDEELSARIAAEMLRVCKPEGYLLLVDWRTPKPGDANYSALTRARLKRLFRVSDGIELVGVFSGALIPPVGRFLSAYLPGLYFLVAALFPFLVGQVAYLLRKKALR